MALPLDDMGNERNATGAPFAGIDFYDLRKHIGQCNMPSPIAQLPSHGMHLGQWNGGGGETAGCFPRVFPLSAHSDLDFVYFSEFTAEIRFSSAHFQLFKNFWTEPLRRHFSGLSKLLLPE